MEQEGSGGGGFGQLCHGIKSSEPPNFKRLSSKCLICDSPPFRHIIIQVFVKTMYFNLVPFMERLCSVFMCCSNLVLENLSRSHSRVSALAGCDRLVSEQKVIAN